MGSTNVCSTVLPVANDGSRLAKSGNKKLSHRTLCGGSKRGNMIVKDSIRVTPLLKINFRYKEQMKKQNAAQRCDSTVQPKLFIE